MCVSGKLKGYSYGDRSRGKDVRKRDVRKKCGIWGQEEKIRDVKELSLSWADPGSFPVCSCFIISSCLGKDLRGLEDVGKKVEKSCGKQKIIRREKW